MSSKPDIVKVYKRVNLIIWERLGPTFGVRTINAIAKNAIARRQKQHPYLANLKTTSDGLVWDDFDAHLDQVSEDEVSAMLEDVTDEFFDALATLIGRLVVGKIFQEAEQEVRKETP